MTLDTFLGNLVTVVLAITVCAMLVCLMVIAIRVTVNVVRHGELWP